MAKITVLKQTPINMAELALELEKIKARDIELTVRSAKTYEFLAGLKLNTAKTEELVRKINELAIPRLKPEHIVKLVDVLPASIEELKLVMQTFMVTISAENLKRLAELLAQYSQR